MLTRSATTLFLTLLIGSMTSSVSGYWKTKGDKSTGFLHPQVMRTAGTGCPQGTRFIGEMNSPGRQAGNFVPKCEPLTNMVFVPAPFPL